jgi:hypothetical protein
MRWLCHHSSNGQPKTYAKPEAAITVFEHLMLGGVSPETCWAIKKYWNNKFYYTVASCWFFLWVSTLHGIHVFRKWNLGKKHEKNNDKLFHKVTLLHISCFKLLVLFNRRHYLFQNTPAFTAFLQTSNCCSVQGSAPLRSCDNEEARWRWRPAQSLLLWLFRIPFVAATSNCCGQSNKWKFYLSSVRLKIQVFWDFEILRPVYRKTAELDCSVLKMMPLCSFQTPAIIYQSTCPTSHQYRNLSNIGFKVSNFALISTAGNVQQSFSTFVRPRLGKLFFHKTKVQSQQIYS